MTGLFFDMSTAEGRHRCAEEAARRAVFGQATKVAFVEPDRSSAQNRLQRLWMLEAERQGDHTAEEYRGLCKLHFGVPILMRSPKFAERYNQVFAPFPYETKLSLMMVPFDFPVTRLMKVREKTEYLDAVYTHFTGRGMRLTAPDLKEYEQYREAEQ